MEDISFDISGILSDEEAEKIFDEQKQEQENEKEKPEGEETSRETEKENAESESENNAEGSERVGNGEIENEKDVIPNEGDGSSPNAYSSIADALRKDNIFPDFTDEEIEAVKTPEDFAELFRKAIKAGEDKRIRRVNEALDNGIEPNTVQQYERTIEYLDSISEESISAEGDEGEDLRKHLIYNDLINRGYTQDKAQKELEKSFKAGSDIDDAKDALEALKTFYKDGYDNIQKEAKKKAEDFKEAQKKQAESFRKLVLEDEVKIGSSVLDKRTCQKVFDAVSKPVYKDSNTGKLLTAVQKYQMENPLEFLKQLGMWYVLTEGGKNIDGFTKGKVQEEKNKSIRELGRKINTTSLSRDGSLQFVGGSSGNSDPLLSDGWKVDFR